MKGTYLPHPPAAYATRCRGPEGDVQPAAGMKPRVVVPPWRRCRR